MSYFDFHFHPAFKQGIVEFEGYYPTRRSENDLVKEFHLKSSVADFFEDNFLHILEGQSSIDQLNHVTPVVGVAAIAPIELFFTHRHGLFGKLLNGAFTDPFDKRFMDVIRKGEISYYHLFLKELSLYRKLADKKKINLITRKNPKSLDDPKGINLVLAMEGGHGLSRTLIGRPGEEDLSAQKMRTHDDKEITDEVWKDFVAEPSLSPQESLKNLQKALWKEDLDLCILTLTHLQHISEQLLATHAYGMKMIKATEAYPKGNGLTELGVEVVNAAYDMKVGRTPASILIDIKHMGLKARTDLYKLRAERRMAGKKNPPLVATHMGVTGYTIDEWKLALDKKSLTIEKEPMRVGFNIERCHAGKWGVVNSKFSYNAWSIGLMDDDIIEVVNSGGLIGVSLDVRVLGWQPGYSKKDIMEYMSTDDFRFFFPREYAKLRKAKGIAEESLEEESFLLPDKEERHALALCLNIIHIVMVISSATDTDDPWQYICIGSDFDGLIDPMKTCRNIRCLNQLKKDLKKWLPKAQKAYHEAHGGEDVLDMAGKIDRLIERIVYENGVEFLRGWLRGFKGEKAEKEELDEIAFQVSKNTTSDTERIE